MLSREENDLLTRVGAGTPMGELFRRFWLPAMLSEEAQTDGSPVRLRLLGEDLVAFRDTNGQVGIIDAYCPHKLAGLFWGRNEECGLRCTYHGWKYDVQGQCVDMPNEPPDSNYKTKVKVKSYPAQEAAGVVWIYMGPKETMPPSLPQYAFVAVPEGYSFVSKWLQESNWCQGMEGEIDTSHISFLHRWFDPDAMLRPRVFSRFRSVINTKTGQPVNALGLASLDGAPRLTVKETDFGFHYGSRRNAEDDLYYWRTSLWMLPMWSMITGGGGRGWVPIDDEHTWTFSYLYRMDSPFTEEEKDEIRAGLAGFPPETYRCAYQMPDGYVIDTWRAKHARENDYLISREDQKTKNYTGIPGVNDQDRSIQESMVSVPGKKVEQIVDRTREHLGTADTAVIAARRVLLRLAKALQEGQEPYAPSHPDAFKVRSFQVVSPEADFFKLLEQHQEEVDALARI